MFGTFFTQPVNREYFFPMLFQVSPNQKLPGAVHIPVYTSEKESATVADPPRHAKKKQLNTSAPHRLQEIASVLLLPELMIRTFSFSSQKFPLLVLLCICFLLPSTKGWSQTLTQTCTLTPHRPGDHAFWMNALPGDMTRDYVFLPPGGTLNFYSDSTAQVLGRIVNQSDSTRQWDVELWVEDPLDYAAWSALGRGIKNGGGADSTQYQDWLFYILDESRSTMTGVPGTHFDGDTLNILHKPRNLNFGFQLGIGANDKTIDYGFSGWFYFRGSHEGRGDINVNVECDTIPPPTCTVAIDTFYASCKSDSTFEMNISFTGNGSNFEISDDQGTTVVGGLSSGTYTFGEYFNSTDVRLTVSDPNFPNCTETTFPVTLDCTPVPVCEFVVDTIYTQCMTDSTFSVVVGIQGTSNSFIISDNQGTFPLDSLSAGVYTYGSYPQDSAVTVLVTDWAVFNCFQQFDGLTDTCSADTSGVGMAVGSNAPEVYIDPVFPNPVNQFTQIRVRSEEPTMMNFTIRIVDAMGRTQQVNQRMIKEGIQEFNLPVSELDAGLYFMSFGVDGYVIDAQRILVNK